MELCGATAPMVKANRRLRRLQQTMGQYSAARRLLANGSPGGVRPLWGCNHPRPAHPWMRPWTDLWVWFAAPTAAFLALSLSSHGASVLQAEEQSDQAAEVIEGSPQEPVKQEPVKQEPAKQEPAKPAPGVKPSQQRWYGQVIVVDGELNDAVDRRIRRLAAQARTRAARRGQELILIFELQPGATKPGRAMDLATYLTGRDLAGAKTVAYIPKELTGYGVLVALACEQIVMAADAKIGNIDPKGAPKHLQELTVTIANLRRTVPEPIVRAMLDPAQELLKVNVNAAQMEYVLAEDLEEFRKGKVIVGEEPIVGANDPAIFTGREGRDLGFVSQFAEDRAQVARAFNLPRDALLADVNLEGEIRAARIDLEGPLSVNERAAVASKQIDRALSQDKNFLLFVINSSGGDAKRAIPLATKIAELPREIRTVAYIQREARADAAIIAMACNQVVLNPDAVLGGAGRRPLDREKMASYTPAIREIAEKTFRPPTLVAAMLDPTLKVHRYTNGLQVRYLTEAEVQGEAEGEQAEDDQADQEQPKQADQVQEQADEVEALPKKANEVWQQGELLNPEGAFQTTGLDAVEKYQLATANVESYEQAKSLFGLEREPELMRPTWAHKLAKALSNEGVAMFLLLIGMMAIWTEMQMPSFGIGWVVGGLCFTLFFWAKFLDGSAQALDVCLFIFGALCLLLEVFVIPGFGIFGLAGGLLIVASLVLASQTFVIPTNREEVWKMTSSLLVVGVAGIGTIIAGLLMRRFLPHTPMFRSLMLAPPSPADTGDSVETDPLAGLVGQRGTATTRLAPAGKATIDGRYLDVIAEGQYLERGQELEVVEARGNRVVVRGL